MTLMVLAIRLYDVGPRDDAVFWFYAAKDRYISLLGAIDENALGSAPDAVRSFADARRPGHQQLRVLQTSTSSSPPTTRPGNGWPRIRT